MCKGCLINFSDVDDDNDMYIGNHSRRLSTDHSKADRGSRRRKAVNVERASCHSVPASPPTASYASGMPPPPTARSVDRDRSMSAAEPARIRRSLRGVNSVGSPEAV